MKKLFENWREFRNESSADKRAGPLVHSTSPARGIEAARELDRERAADQARAVARAIQKARESDPYPGDDFSLVDLGKEISRLAAYLTSHAGASARHMAVWSEKMLKLPWSRNFRQKIENTLEGSRHGRAAVRTASVSVSVATLLEMLDDYTTMFKNNETVANYNRQQLIGDYRVLYNFLKSEIIDLFKN